MKKNITFWLTFCLLFCHPFYSSGQKIIATVAGTGVAGCLGDGGAAATAQLNGNNGIFVDAIGNILVCDAGNNCVRKITTSGIITTIAGTGIAGFSGDGGQATAAKLNNPGDLVEDALGNIYISDGSNNRIRKINVSGVITTFAGNGATGYAGDGGPATAAVTEFHNPYGLAFDASGSLFIADEFNHCIRKVDMSTGIISTVAGTGSPAYTGDGGLAVAATLQYPIYISFDLPGNMYISDNGNHCIRKVNTSGRIVTIAGTGSPGNSGDGGPATAALLKFPGGTVSDAAGNLYIASGYDYTLRKIDNTGIITTIAGTGIPGYNGDGFAATATQFNVVYDVVFDIDGSLLISDLVNNRIRTFRTDRRPTFTGGHSQTLAVCEEAATANPINSLLAVKDSDVGQIEDWSLVYGPAHGTVTTNYIATSTGGILVPTGLSYTPATGYAGLDSFKVQVFDSLLHDSTTIYVTVNSLPNAGIISGIDSICPGQTITLSETVAGGTWSCSNEDYTRVRFGGTITGLEPGQDTIIYTVINPCGIVSAIFPFTVRSYLTCTTEIGQVGDDDGSLLVYPNPNYGLFTITSKTNGRFSIYNMLGQVVLQSTVMNGNNEVKLPDNIASGIYICKFAPDDGNAMKQVKLLYQR